MIKLYERKEKIEPDEEGMTESWEIKPREREEWEKGSAIYKIGNR